MSAITHEALLRAALRHRRHGITNEQAVLLGLAELEADPLDPFVFDDAAVLLRAERLLIDGVTATDALATARNELATWGLT